MNTDKKEKEYYEAIKTKLEQLLAVRSIPFHLEITADKKFSNELKAHIEPNRDIIFRFLKEAAPDITGFIKRSYSSDFIVVEVKKETIKLDDIYQAKKYQDLFNAKFTFLVSLQPISEEIKRLHKVAFSLLSGPSYHYTFNLAHFNERTNEIVEWYPENPFEKDWRWE